MKSRHVHVKWIIAFYLTIAFFPGCFVSGVFGMAFLEDGLVAFLRGMSWTLLPYELLALVLLVASGIVSLRKIRPIAFARVAIIALLLMIPLLVVTVHYNGIILEFDRGIREYNGTADMAPFARRWLAVWWNGCLFGLAVLLLGLARIARKSERIESHLSEPD